MSNAVTYSVRLVHRRAPRDTDTCPDVALDPGAFSDSKKLGAALRAAGVLSPGVPVKMFRVEADRVVIFPGGPFNVWHSVVLTTKKVLKG